MENKIDFSYGKIVRELKKDALSLVGSLRDERETKAKIDKLRLLKDTLFLIKEYEEPQQKHDGESIDK